MTSNSNNEKIRILVVDDNENELILIQRAFRKSPYHVDLHVVDSGQGALDFLKNEAKPRPDLILLDIHMPCMDGIETLKCIKKDCNIKSIPTVMLTTSNSDIDVSESYFNGANAYLVKPVDMSLFYELVDRITSFWFDHALLPRSHS